MSAGLLTEMHAHLGAGSAEPDDEPDAKRLKVIQPSGPSAGLQAALQVAQPSLQHPSPSNRCLGTRMVHSYAQAIVPLYLQVSPGHASGQCCWQVQSQFSHACVSWQGLNL